MTIDRVCQGRQMRLPEIGEAGQQRLAASHVVLVGEGEAREIEATYLTRAGIGVVADPDAALAARLKARADGEANVHAEALASLGIGNCACRELADGALRALLAARKILAIDGAARKG